MRGRPRLGARAYGKVRSPQWHAVSVWRELAFSLLSPPDFVVILASLSFSLQKCLLRPSSANESTSTADPPLHLPLVHGAIHAHPTHSPDRNGISAGPGRGRASALSMVTLPPPPSSPLTPNQRRMGLRATEYSLWIQTVFIFSYCLWELGNYSFMKSCLSGRQLLNFRKAFHF